MKKFLNNLLGKKYARLICHICQIQCWFKKIVEMVKVMSRYLALLDNKMTTTITTQEEKKIYVWENIYKKIFWCTKENNNLMKILGMQLLTLDANMNRLLGDPTQEQLKQSWPCEKHIQVCLTILRDCPCVMLIAKLN